MDVEGLSKKAESHLKRLCEDIHNRRVGSAGNRAATDYFGQVTRSLGLATHMSWFDCIDWEDGGATLVVGKKTFETFVSPYTLGCQVSAPLVVLASVEELEGADLAGRIPLLRGEIAKEQLMPKNFPFYNPDHHKRIVHLLEAKNPPAIIAATSRNPELAGGLYPFPLIEDGDFDIPSVYMTEEVGEKLARYDGSVLALDSQSRRIPAVGCNVIARKGSFDGQRVVVVAHIDAKIGTPGAIDNATGVIVLLLLAELLVDYSGQLGVEIVAFNGEDYYAAPGQIQYFEQNAGKLAEMALGVNIDGAGYHQGNTAYSLYDCPPELANVIHQAFKPYESIQEGGLWYQSDHSIFLQNQVPAMAITSDRLMDLSTDITHTPRDRPEIVDVARLVYIALGLRDLILRLDRVGR